MMETVRDLNMEMDEMLLVVAALRGVGKRIVEMAQTHKPFFAGELFLTRQEDYPLHTVCREDTLQGFGLGKDVGGELLF